MRGPIYWHTSLYQILIRLLYGRHFRDRYIQIASRIKTGQSVVDLCCGDCRLYAQELAGRAGTYLGLDFNRGFVRHAVRRGISARVWDFRFDPIPEADIVVLQGSLYQFVPHHVEAIERMLRAAGRTVIITEPIKNVAASPYGFLSWAATHLTNPGTHPMPSRFTEWELRELFNRFSLRECVTIAGGRELLGVFDTRGRRA